MNIEELKRKALSVVVKVQGIMDLFSPDAPIESRQKLYKLVHVAGGKRILDEYFAALDGGQQSDIFTPKQREEMSKTTEGTELDETTHITVLNVEEHPNGGTLEGTEYEENTEPHITVLNTEEIPHDEDGNVIETEEVKEVVEDDIIEEPIPVEEETEEVPKSKKRKKK